MDFLANLAKNVQPKPAADKPADHPDGEPKPTASTTDLFTSAKLVADAAQAQFSNQPEKYDKAQVCDAAANLLGAAEEYGKLDQNQGVGKYVDQAENYLRQYSQGTTDPAAVDQKPPASAPVDQKLPETAPPAESEKEKPAAPAPTPTPTETEKPPESAAPEAEPEEKKPTAPVTADDEKATVAAPEKTESEKPSTGSDYIKEAEEVLEKTSEGGAAGVGDYVKAAEGFLEKTSEGGAGGVGEYAKAAEGFLNKPAEGGSESGGIGDYIKTAETFLEKQPGGDASEDGAKPAEDGYGDLIKKAGGFLSK